VLEGAHFEIGLLICNRCLLVLLSCSRGLTRGGYGDPEAGLIASVCAKWESVSGFGVAARVWCWGRQVAYCSTCLFARVAKSEYGI
jgi:hypothetical protein